MLPRVGWYLVSSVLISRDGTLLGKQSGDWSRGALFVVERAFNLDSGMLFQLLSYQQIGYVKGNIILKIMLPTPTVPIP